MDRTSRRLFTIVLVAIVAITLAAALATGIRDGAGTGSAPPGTIPVEGVVVAVDSAGLADVHGFTLRQEGGATMDFRLDRLENGTTFPPGHLSEHQATADPVRVWYLDSGGVHFAIRIDDARR